MLGQSCLTLCNTLHYSPPGSSVYGIFQAKILELPFPPPGDLPHLETEPTSLMPPASQVGSLLPSHLGSLKGWREGSLGWHSVTSGDFVTWCRFVRTFLGKIVLFSVPLLYRVFRLLEISKNFYDSS